MLYLGGYSVAMYAIQYKVDLDNVNQFYTGENMSKLLCVADVARILSASNQTVQRMAARGDIPAVKIGRRWYVPEDRFNDFVRKCCDDKQHL